MPRRRRRRQRGSGGPFATAVVLFVLALLSIGNVCIVAAVEITIDLCRLIPYESAHSPLIVLLNETTANSSGTTTVGLVNVRGVGCDFAGGIRFVFPGSQGNASSLTTLTSPNVSILLTNATVQGDLTIEGAPRVTTIGHFSFSLIDCVVNTSTSAIAMVDLNVRTASFVIRGSNISSERQILYFRQRDALFSSGAIRAAFDTIDIVIERCRLEVIVVPTATSAQTSATVLPACVLFFFCDPSSAPCVRSTTIVVQSTDLRLTVLVDLPGSAIVFPITSSVIGQVRDTTMIFVNSHWQSDGTPRFALMSFQDADGLVLLLANCSIELKATGLFNILEFLGSIRRSVITARSLSLLARGVDPYDRDMRSVFYVSGGLWDSKVSLGDVTIDSNTGGLRFVVLTRSDSTVALSSNTTALVERAIVIHDRSYRSSTQIVYVGGVGSTVQVTVLDSVFHFTAAWNTVFFVADVRGLVLVARRNIISFESDDHWVLTGPDDAGTTMRDSSIEMTDNVMLPKRFGCLSVAIGAFSSNIDNVSIAFQANRFVLVAAFNRQILRFTRTVRALHLTVSQFVLDESAGQVRDSSSLVTFESDLERSVVTLSDVVMSWRSHCIWCYVRGNVRASNVTLIRLVGTSREGFVHRGMEVGLSVDRSTLLIYDVNLTLHSGSDPSGILLITGGNLTHSNVIARQLKIICIQECYVASFRNYVQFSIMILSEIVYQRASPNGWSGRFALVGWSNLSLTLPSGTSSDSEPTTSSSRSVVAFVRCVSETVLANISGYTLVSPCLNASIPRPCAEVDCAIQALVPASLFGESRRCRCSAPTRSLSFSDDSFTTTRHRRRVSTSISNRHHTHSQSGHDVSATAPAKTMKSQSVIAQYASAVDDETSVVNPIASGTVPSTRLDRSTTSVAPTLRPVGVNGTRRQANGFKSATVTRGVHPDIQRIIRLSATADRDASAYHASIGIAAVASLGDASSIWVAQAALGCRARPEPTGLLVAGLVPLDWITSGNDFDTSTNSGHPDDRVAPPLLTLRTAVASCLLANMVAFVVGAFTTSVIRLLFTRDRVVRHICRAADAIAAVAVETPDSAVQSLLPPIALTKSRSSVSQATVLFAAAGLPSTAVALIGPTADPLLAAAFALLVGFPIDPSGALALQIVAAVCVVGGFAAFVAFIGRAVVTQSMIFVPSRGMSKMPEWLRVSGRWEDPECPAAFVAFTAMYGPLFARLRAGSLPGRWDRGHVLAELSLAAIGSCLRGALQPRGLCVALSVCNLCIALVYVGLAATMPRSIAAVNISRVPHRLLVASVVVLTAGVECFGWNTAYPLRASLSSVTSVWRMVETLVVLLALRRARWEDRRALQGGNVDGQAEHNLPPSLPLPPSPATGVQPQTSTMRPRASDAGGTRNANPLLVVPSQ